MYTSSNVATNVNAEVRSCMATRFSEDGRRCMKKMHFIKMCSVSEICKYPLLFTILAVVSRKTGFSIDWLFLGTLATLHGNESFSSISTTYNDFFNEK